MSQELHPVAYIMSRFPGLSETFILREMCEMEKLGWQLDLYPLIYQEENVIHEEAKGWMKRAKRPSFLAVISANFMEFLKRPVLYLTVLFEVFLGNLSSLNFLSRAVIVFPKAVWMAQNMLRENIRHVHVHYATHPALTAWVIKKFSGIPYGVTVHAHDIFVDKSMLHRKLLDATYIIAISKFNKQYLIREVGEWVAEKTHVIHCGIYPEMYHQTVLERNERFEILSIGSLRPYKGFSFLLDACHQLKHAGINFRCRIIGGGELHRSLCSKIEELKISDKVELLGSKNQTEVAGLLQTTHCYVQPSIITKTGKMEGIPVSLMEAMASKVPVVASELSGIPELVLHEKTGLLVPPENPHLLAEAIMQICSNIDRSNKMSQNGRELVLQEFNIYKTASQLSGLFKTLFQESQHK